MPNPPSYTAPSSGSMPNTYPYNRLGTGGTAGASVSPTAPAARPASGGPKSPEQRTSQPAPAGAASQAGRPGDSTVKSPFARPGSTESSHAAGHTIPHHHHHHHHVHSHTPSASPYPWASTPGGAKPSTPSQTPASASATSASSASATTPAGAGATGGNASSTKPSVADRPSPFSAQSASASTQAHTSSQAQTPGQAQPTSTTSQQPPSTTNASSMGTPSTNSNTPTARANPSPSPFPTMADRYRGYGGVFSGFQMAERQRAERERLEREKREREYRERMEKERAEREKLERERKAAAGPTSPTAKTSSASPFGRPGQPPSPSVSRATPTGVKPPSPKTSTSTTPAGARPNLPLAGFGSLGARALPSPFHPDRPGSTASDTPPTTTAHHRTLSNSSNRDTVGQTSPRTETARPQAGRTNIFGQPAPIRQDASRSPVTSTASPATTAAKPPAPTTATQSAVNRPPGYSTYSSYAPSYMGFGGGFGGYGGFGAGNWGERERMIKAREKEAEKERERERERLAELQRQEERRKQEAQAASTAAKAQAQAQSAAARDTRPVDPWRRDPYGRHDLAQPRPAPTTATANQSRIEVLNHPNDVVAPQTATALFPATAVTSQNAASTDPSVIQQVAPTREPRPYTYAAKPEPQSQPPVSSSSVGVSASNAKERDYTYNPRDKRPRMDAAVDDARRGASKAKRRKEDDRAKDHSPGYGVRDLAALSRATKKWPEVNSGQVEAWLKNELDLTRVVSRQVYGGADWTLAQTDATQRLNEGGIVLVRVNGAFLGSSWVVRGEKGWDETSPYPSGDVELGRGLKKRSIWGTDVYSDDSDLGLVLIHAGWIRWTLKTDEEVQKAAGAVVKDKRAKRDDDVIEVTVRVVPKLVRYTATERNGVRTRGWGNGHDGASIVVEGVKRVTLDKKTLKTRANRKAQLAELARQRKVALGDYGVPGVDHFHKDGAEQPIIFTQKGPALRYDPAALEKAMHYTPSAVEDPAPKPFDPESDPEPYNLFTHDLEFVHGGDRYLLHSINMANYPLELDLKQYLKSKPGRAKILAEYIQPEDLHFAKDGIAVETHKTDEGDVRGVFVKVEGFMWKDPPSEDEYDHSEDGSYGEDEEDKDGEGKEKGGEQEKKEEGEQGKGGKEESKGEGQEEDRAGVSPGSKAGSRAGSPASAASAASGRTGSVISAK